MFLRSKTFKNKDGTKRVYAQIVASRRVNGSSRHVTLLDLGRMDQVEDRKKVDDLIRCLVRATDSIDFLNVNSDLKANDAKEFGTSLIFRRVWDELGLGRIISKQTGNQKADFDISDCVFNMVLNRLSAPSSKRRLESWQENIYGVNSYDIHQYYRALDYLIDSKDGIEKDVFDGMRDLFNISVDVILFDTTTIVYYGEGEDDEEELLRKGFSKAKRSDLKQIVVGVLMSKEGIPLGHEVFAGNNNDVTCFKKIIGKIAEKFNVDKVILVGDRGMISKKNIKILEDANYEYILGFRMRTISKDQRAEVLSKAKLKVIKKDSLHWKEVIHQGQRLIVCYNPERAKLDCQRREDTLERIREKIKEGTTIDAIITNQDYKRFLKIEGKNPTLDEDKIKADALYDGVYVITSNTKMTPGELIESYKDLWQVEQAFRRLKSEIEMGPLYHWKDRRIRAHIMICFFALMLRNELYRRLQAKYKKVSFPLVLQDMKALKVVSLDVRGEQVHLRTEFKPGAMQSIRALGMRAPARVLQSDQNKSLLV